MDQDKLKISTTTNGQPPDPGFENSSAPAPIEPETGMHRSYWVLSEEERRKGFIRPVRTQYKHLVCGTVTRMGLAIAETFARAPPYYGATFCVECMNHFPVGEHGEFVWLDENQKVGT